MRFRILTFVATLPAVALFAMAANAAGNSAAEDGRETSSLEPGLEQEWRDSNLPSLLSNADIGRYRVIFQLQEDGEWKAADKIIAKLDDRVLMGHVLAQRYLHPTKYRTRYKELKAWMDKYADHPQARRLYELALTRKPRNWKAPKPPTAGAGVYLGGSGHGGHGKSLTYRPSKPLNAADRKKARSYEQKLKWYTRKGWTKSVKQLIQTKEVKRLLHPVTFDRARATLGNGYLVDGKTQWALDWAGAAARRSGKYLPNASWTAGLAAWQLGKFDEAAKYFRTVATSRYADSWLKSAGGFWASRSYLRARQPENVNQWLGHASAYPHTFYGMLARQTLGLKITFNWAPPPFAMEAMKELSAAQGGRRAVTLMQIGEDRRAERELRILFAKASPELARAMLALADRADMPTLAMRLGALLARNGASHYDSTAYPIPELSVEKDTLRDPALVLALIRQE
ncbi:MAG: lytic transglycosylase domain-containing protein, partial [Proteobacteria bacterium]|nr:lytic transglycosylase domain-containing protein [Pseudomonadota bacterium]